MHGFLFMASLRCHRIFVEAYFELNVVISIWGVVWYSVFGLITGFSADICFKMLNDNTKINKRIIAGISGVFMSLVYFILILIALGFFYKVGWGRGHLLNKGLF